MNQNQIVTERVVVTVAGRMFEVPSEKVPQLTALLESWKTIRVQENGTNNGGKWHGQTLLHG